jgi:ribonuclease R
VAAITSRAQLTYGAVDAWLDGDESDVRGEAGLAGGEVVDVLRGAIEAARRLGASATRAPPSRTCSRPPSSPRPWSTASSPPSTPSPHAAAYRFIERLMVAANEAVASWLIAREVPALYRAHIGVDPERAARLHAAAEAVGVSLAGARAVSAGTASDADQDAVSAELLAAIEELRAAGRDEDHDLLVAAATSSIARATYEPDPSSHRGSPPARTATSPRRSAATRTWSSTARSAPSSPARRPTTPPPAPRPRRLDRRPGRRDRPPRGRERGDLWARLLDRGFLGTTPEPAVVTGVTQNGVKIRLPRLGVTGFVTAERGAGSHRSTELAARSRTATT